MKQKIKLSKVKQFIHEAIINEIDAVNRAKNQAEKISASILKTLERNLPGKELELGASNAPGKYIESIGYLDNKGYDNRLGIVVDFSGDDVLIYFTVSAYRNGSGSTYYRGSNRQSAIKNFIKLLRNKT